MRTKRYRLPFIGLLSMIICIAGLTCDVYAQNAQPTPAAGGGNNWESIRNMSREERMRRNRERITKILAEDKARKEEERKKNEAKAGQQQPQQAAQPQPGAPQPGAPAPGVPGQAVPGSPVQPFVPNAGAPTPTPAPKATKPEPARDQSRTLLFLMPMDSIVNVGDTFETDIMVDTKTGHTDDIRFLLCYPPNKLNPLAVDFGAIADRASDKIAYEVDNHIGELWMRIPLKKAEILASVPVVTITWEALAPTEAGQIRFGFVANNEEASTGMYLEGDYILGTEHDHQCGVLDGSVVIRDKKRKDYIQQIGHRDLVISSTDYVMPPATMQICLDSKGKKTAAVGETFKIEVTLANPYSRQLDGIQAYVQYDPKVLEIVDTDKNNWIREGVNGADAFAHAVFPFDFFRRNHADNDVGDFVYDAIAASSPVRSSGTFVELTFRAKAVADRTEIVLVANDPGFTPTTDVTYLKTSMLKGKPNKATVLNGLSLRVVPSPNGETVLKNTKKKSLNRTTRYVPENRGKRIY